LSILNAKEGQKIDGVKIKMSHKVECAKAAAPYCHARLAPTHPKLIDPKYSIDLTKFNNEELAEFERLVAKAQVPIDLEADEYKDMGATEPRSNGNGNVPAVID
jgi:hypothetical protein